MKVDSEEQRQFLLQIIKSTLINGPWEKVLPTIQVVGKLKTEVEKAEIE